MYSKYMRHHTHSYRDYRDYDDYRDRDSYYDDYRQDRRPLWKPGREPIPGYDLSQGFGTGASPDSWRDDHKHCHSVDDIHSYGASTEMGAGAGPTQYQPSGMIGDLHARAHEFSQGEVVPPSVAARDDIPGDSVGAAYGASEGDLQGSHRTRQPWAGRLTVPSSYGVSPLSVGEGSTAPQPIPLTGVRPPMVGPTRQRDSAPTTVQTGPREQLPAGPRGPAPQPMFQSQIQPQPAVALAGDMLTEAKHGIATSQAEAKILEMEEKIRSLEAKLTWAISAKQTSNSKKNLFQSPDKAILGDQKRQPINLEEVFELARSQSDDQPCPERKAPSTPINDRLVKGWLKEIKQYDPNKENFKIWLVEAESRMDKEWDLDTRVNCLKSKFGLNEAIKLEQIIQHMEDNNIEKSWKAIRDRLLQIFPGAIDTDIAEFTIQDLKQADGETFRAWADRVTSSYIAAFGEKPSPGVFEKLVFNGLKLEYKMEWKDRDIENVWDATVQLTEWEARKWQELNLPNPAEGGIGRTHLVTTPELTGHSARAIVLTANSRPDGNPEKLQSFAGGDQPQSDSQERPARRKGQKKRSEKAQNAGGRSEKFSPAKRKRERSGLRGQSRPPPRPEFKTARERDREIPTCNACGRKGHSIFVCRKVKCFNCGRKGHIAENCRDRFQKSESARESWSQNRRTSAHLAASIDPEVEPASPKSGKEQAPSSDLGEVARAAELLSEKLKKLTKPKWEKIFPYPDKTSPL